MKRKPTRDIPDFSSKRPMKGGNPFLKDAVTKAKPIPQAPKIKPPSTSSKSGRRGS